MAAKVGRPTDSLKDGRVTARVDAGVKKILEEYCKKHGVSQAEGVRQAILKLKENK